MSAIIRRPRAASRVLARVLAPLGLAAAVLVARPALAQSHDDADTRAINAYTLTMPKVEAWMNATLDMYKAAKAKAAAEGEDGASEDEDDDASGNESLDETAARINRMPEARRALRAAGLTAREYTLVSLTLMQAMMADAMMRQYPKMERPKINQANLAFVQKNRAHLEARMNALKAAGFGQDQ